VDPNDSGMTKALLDPLYDAATEPQMWSVFLQRASEALRADTAGIVLHDPGSKRTSVCVDLGFTDEMRQDAERLTRVSPWMAEIQKHQAQGWYCGSPEDVLPMEKFRKSKFYNDFFLKHKIEWAGAAVVFGPEGSAPGLAVTRQKSGQPFDARDKELLRQLLPHLGRVFKVYRAFSALRDRKAAGQHALDLMGAACVTLDQLGKVLSVNRRAEALIADGTSLRIKDRRLLSVLTVEQRALDTCLLKACACGAGKSTDPGTGAVVLHSAQARSLYVSVLPYHSRWPLLEGRPSALLFITTPEEQGQGDHRLWQTMFALSPAECRVAEMMKQGLEVGEISEAIRIKVDTVRYYQKCIYRKIGVRGQSQMIRLLTRLPSSSP
jgi:DNA-binding CsgD family transcriptional regulator